MPDKNTEALSFATEELLTQQENTIRLLKKKIEAMQALQQAEEELAASSHLYLENAISDGKACISQEAEIDMTKRQRFKFTLPNGETVWITGATINEAFENGVKRYAQSFQIEEARQPAPTLREFVTDTYMPSYFPTLRKTTARNYDMYLRLYILPFMGDMKMDEVSVSTFQQFGQWMASASQRGCKADLNAKSIERVWGFAGRVFAIAEAMDIIRKNPFQKKLLRNPGKPAGHHTAMPDVLIARIKKEIPNLENERERLYMGLLALSSGMRPEEVLGLRWEDLVLNNHYGVISRTVTFPDNSAPYIGPPKTKGSGRTILLSEALVDILKPLAKPEGFILGGEQPFSYSTVQRLTKSAFTNLGIYGIVSPYDFRATFATQMKESGMTSAQVADLLGHADTRMVETIYARTRHEGVMKMLDDVNTLHSA